MAMLPRAPSRARPKRLFLQLVAVLLTPCLIKIPSTSYSATSPGQAFSPTDALSPRLISWHKPGDATNAEWVRSVPSTRPLPANDASTVAAFLGPLTWMVGQGDYARRTIPPGYPHLLSAEEERREWTGSVATGDLSQEIREGRLRHGAEALDDPARRKKWERARDYIRERLETIRAHHGDTVYETLRLNIEAIETYLPLVGDSKDNFERYVLDTEHGLAHSLAALDEILLLAQTVYARRGTEYATVVPLFMGTALFHDLTGLRDRVDHHATARDLVLLILPHITDRSGQRLYTDRQVQEVADGCYRHRGQSFPKPLKLWQKIFVDVDEYIMLDDIQRQLDQPSNGIFQVDVWDLARRYVTAETRKSDGKRFKHETPDADRFQYLLSTLIERTNPDNYQTIPAKQRVQARYQEIKPLIMNTLEHLLRQEMRREGKSILEADLAMRRMEGVVTELRALRLKKPEAFAQLRGEIGTPQELKARVLALARDLESGFSSGIGSHEYRDASLFLSLALDARAIGKSATADIFTSERFKMGRALFENSLEDRGNSAAEKIGEYLLRVATDKAISSSEAYLEYAPMLYAGFAYGLAVACMDRIADLFDMSGRTSTPRRHRWGPAERTFAAAAAKRVLTQLASGVEIPAALNKLRLVLEHLRYPALPWGPHLDLSVIARNILDWVRSRPTSNLHMHTTGLPTPEFVARIYRDRPELVPIFQARLKRSVDPRDPQALRQLAYRDGTVDSPAAFEEPFLAGTVALENDDAQFTLHHRWYREAVVSGRQEGNAVINVISTFSSQAKSRPAFEAAVWAGLEGLLEGERAVDYRTRGFLTLGLSKYLSPDQTGIRLDWWLTLKNRFAIDHPELASRMLGVDSVGHEEGFDFKTVEAIYRDAHDKGQYVRFHVGEFWKPGKIEDALRHIQEVVDSGVVDHPTNAIALFVDPSTLSGRYYTPQQRKEVGLSQAGLIARLNQKEMTVEISPTSNEAMSQSSRLREGWAYVRLSTRLREGLRIVLSDDDPGLFGTTFADEHLRVRVGASAYGPITHDLLELLLRHSERQAARILQRAA